MSTEHRVAEISEAVDNAREAIEALRERGAGIPTVEKNCIRMLGTLRQLEVQFCDLAAAIKDEGNGEPPNQGE